MEMEKGQNRRWCKMTSRSVGTFFLLVLIQLMVKVQLASTTLAPTVCTYLTPGMCGNVIIALPHYDLTFSSSYYKPKAASPQLQPQFFCRYYGFQPLDFQQVFEGDKQFREAFYTEKRLHGLQFYYGVIEGATNTIDPSTERYKFIGSWRGKFVKVSLVGNLKYSLPQLCMRKTALMQKRLCGTRSIRIDEYSSFSVEFEPARRECRTNPGFDLPTKEDLPQLQSCFNSKLNIWTLDDLKIPGRTNGIQQYLCIGCNVPFDGLFGVESIDAKGRLTCKPGYTADIPVGVIPKCVLDPHQNNYSSWDISTVGRCRRDSYYDQASKTMYYIVETKTTTTSSKTGGTQWPRCQWGAVVQNFEANKALRLQIQAMMATVGTHPIVAVNKTYIMDINNNVRFYQKEWGLPWSFCKNPVRPCDAGAPLNGISYATTKTVAHGATVRFGCLSGYSIRGTMDYSVRESTCYDGSFSPREPYCVANCFPVPPVNGKATATGLADGQIVTYSCLHNLAMSGSSTSACQNGVLNPPPPTCLGCVALISNGSLSVAPHGRTASFSCKSDFLLVGSTNATCLQNGDWSSPPPRCVDLRCHVSPPLNGLASMTVLHPGQPVAFRCNDGYELFGNATSTCRNGALMTPVPICKACALPIVNNQVYSYINSTTGVTKCSTHYFWKCLDNDVCSREGQPQPEKICNNGYWRNVGRCVFDNYATYLGYFNAGPLPSGLSVNIETATVSCAAGLYESCTNTQCAGGPHNNPVTYFVDAASPFPTWRNVPVCEQLTKYPGLLGVSAFSDTLETAEYAEWACNSNGLNLMSAAEYNSPVNFHDPTSRPNEVWVRNVSGKVGIYNLEANLTYPATDGVRSSFFCITRTPCTPVANMRIDHGAMYYVCGDESEHLITCGLNGEWSEKPGSRCPQ